MMDFQYDHYYLSVAYVTPGIDPMTLRTMDWMATIYRCAEDENKWHLKGRIRFYEDGKIFESKDQKHWFEATSDGVSEEEALKSLKDMANHVARLGGGHVDMLEVRGNGGKFMKQMATRDWSHMKMVFAPDKEETINLAEGFVVELE